MNIAVIGLGMVSPLGLSPGEHAFFLRAGARPSAPGAFLDADGERLDALYCAWLGARLPVAERLRALGTAALGAAMAPLGLRAQGGAGAPPRALRELFVCTDGPRAGLTEAERDASMRGLAAAASARSVKPLAGAAGFFEALLRAEALLESGPEGIVAVVAVDSLIALPALDEARRATQGPWASELPLPSEGAAAVLLATTEEARRQGIEVLATIRHTGMRRGGPGEPADESTAVVDGRAMTELLRGLPALGRRVTGSYGPHEVGSLRRRSWEMASARAAHLFDPACAFASIESEIGQVGAAAGAMSFTHGIAVHRHRAWPGDAPLEGPLVAWAIARDGSSGLSALEPRAASGPRFAVATRDRPRAVALSGQPRGAAVVTALQTAASSEGAEEGGADPARVDPQLATPSPLADVYASIVEGCADTIAMLARHRDERSVKERADAEGRILAQVDAIAATGEGAIADLKAWWRARAEEGDDPHRVWAMVFTLGSIDGPEARLALHEVVRALPDDDLQGGRLAADALSVLTREDALAQASELLASPEPMARAVGLDVVSRRGGMLPAAIAKHLDDASPAVIVAAIRALVRHPEVKEPPTAVLRHLHHPDADVAWEAARAITLWGRRDAYLELRDGGPLAEVLGARGLEIFVMAGELEDLARMQAIVTRCPPSREVLSAIARFGAPASWAFLSHFLRDGDLADAARDALTALFGPCVPEDAASNPVAWRDAIGGRQLVSSVRHRRGAPWAPEVVLAECGSGDLRRAEVELRLDELRARTGARFEVDLSLWAPEARVALGTATGAMRRS